MESQEALLGRFGIDRRKLDDYQVLCLPENFQDAKLADELYDTLDGLDLCKKMKDRGLKCANSVDLGIDTKVRKRLAADIWLGTVWVIEHFALPLAVGIIVNRIAGRRQSTAHLTLILPDKDNLRILRYEDNSKAAQSQLNDLKKEFLPTRK